MRFELRLKDHGLGMLQASCNHSLKASEHFLFVTLGRRQERLNLQWLLVVEELGAAHSGHLLSLARQAIFQGFSLFFLRYCHP